MEEPTMREALIWLSLAHLRKDERRQIRRDIETRMVAGRAHASDAEVTKVLDERFADDLEEASDGR